MGNACQHCFAMFQKPKTQNQKAKQKQPPQSSQRRMIRKTQVEFYNHDQQTASDEKKQGACDSSLNSSCQDAKAFSRRQSVALGSNFGQRKSCMSNLSTIAFDQGSVVIMGPGSKINKSNYRKQEYYSVIDNVYMIRKTADSLKVTSPSGKTSELNCPPQYLASTLFAAQGIPLESILQIGNQKTIIQNNNSPIKLTIRLCCLSCKKKVKLTFCKSYVNIQDLKCKNQKCQKKAGWSLLDIDANAAIWADGRKMDNHQQLEQAPSQIRVMGCIICMRYSNLTKQLKCGCMICKNCLTVNQIQQIQCPICQADVFLQ